MKRWIVLSAVAASLTVLGRGTSHACVGTACLDVWSTADGGGALTVQWPFETKKVQTYQGFCAPDMSLCLYYTIDEGFMAPTVDADPNDSYYVLKDGTVVSIVILGINLPPDAPPNASVSLNVNGKKLSQPTDTALLGVMPTIHVHPSWQVVVPGNYFGTYSISFKLTTDSLAYMDSVPFTIGVVNVPPATPGPTSAATPSPTPTACPGDCNSDGTVTVDELLMCVGMALGSEEPCAACDANQDGNVTVDEILAAVDAALNGCPMPPPATLQEIQDTIFTPRCALPACHDAATAFFKLDLTAGKAYGQLVDVSPTTPAAASAGLLRVDPGHPDNSFLYLKVTNPPPGEGTIMPQTGLPLSADQVQLIRDWILQGANP